MDSNTTASVYLAFANHNKKKKGVQHLKSLYDSLAPILQICEQDTNVNLLREDKEGAPFAYELLQGGFPLPGLTLIHLEADSPADGEWFLNAAGGKRLGVDWDILFLDHLKDLKLIYVDKGASLDVVEKLLFAGAPAVIGTRFEDQDRESEIFRSKFYAELAAGKSLGVSFEAASSLIERECILKKIPSDPYEYWESKEKETDTVFKWGLYCHSNNEAILDWSMIDPEKVASSVPIIPPPPPIEKPVAEEKEETLGLPAPSVQPDFREPKATEEVELSKPVTEIAKIAAESKSGVEEPLIYGSESIEDVSIGLAPEKEELPIDKPELDRVPQTHKPTPQVEMPETDASIKRLSSWEVEDQFPHKGLSAIRVRETQLIYQQSEAFLKEFSEPEFPKREETSLAVTIVEKEDFPEVEENDELNKQEYPEVKEESKPEVNVEPKVEPEQKSAFTSITRVEPKIEEKKEDKPEQDFPEIDTGISNRTSTDPNIVPIRKEETPKFEPVTTPIPTPAYQTYSSPATPTKPKVSRKNTSIKPYVSKTEVLIAKPRRKKLSIAPIINSKPLIYTGIGLAVVGLILAGFFIFSGMETDDSWTADQDNYLAAFGDGDTYNILLLPFQEYPNCVAVDAFNETAVRDQINLFQEGKDLGVKVKFIGDASCPKNSEDARRIGQVYNADMVVWGNYPEIKDDTSQVHARYISLRNNNNFLGSQSKNLGKLALGDNYDLQEGYLGGEVNDVVNWLLGIVTLREEKYAEALQLLKQLDLPETHESSNLFHLMAKCYQGLEQYDQVLQAYNQVIFLSPDNANAYHNRGLLYQHLKQEDQAIADFSEAIRLNPRHIKALYNRNLLKEGDVDDDFYVDPELMQTTEEVWDTERDEDSDTFLQEEIQLVTDTDRSNTDPVDAKLEPGMLRDAGEQIEDLYESQSFENMTSAETYFSDGVSLEQRGRLSDAVEAYKNAIEASPRESNYYHARAKVYEKIGKLKDALNDYTTASQLAPKNTEIYLNRAYLYERMHKNYEAIADYTKITNLLPNSPGAYLYRGKAYQFVKQPRKSLADFEKAISLNPNDATGYYFRARLHVMLKKPNLAIEDFSRAIDINPGYASAYRERGELYTNRGLYEDAVFDFNKVLSLNPRDANIYSRRAEMHRELGNIDQAVKDMEQAIRLAPGNKRFKNMLAKIEDQ